MRRTSLFVIALAVPFTAASATPAALETDPCLVSTRALMGKEQRFLHTVVFGQPAASLARTGSVRYDKSGNSWVKTRSNTWLTLASGFQNTTYSDQQMESQSEHAKRRGLLEVRQSLTSELVPPLAQSLRAFRCRLAAICALADESEQSTSSSLTISVDGCYPRTEKRLTSCTFRSRDPAPARTAVLQQCADDASQTFAQESALLEATIAYDASYRTLLQIAGGFDAFFEDLRDPLLSPLRSAARAIGELQRIPCFLSECHE
ncbi:MAG: hypothetical protein G01um101425_167 [Candidatus Peregrinibacteria bacterium Gr01-1014_25]|nr:MAG: hypothetical protein G01um101425_167 [Candidatus Peregrinibacteria bacterium Gr01-1014_25]